MSPHGERENICNRGGIAEPTTSRTDRGCSPSELQGQVGAGRGYFKW